MNRAYVGGLLVCLGAPWLSGCALTSKADALSPRYFSPEQRPTSNAKKQERPLELRLGQVASASHLDERISYRVSSSEVGFYEERRWTELPEAYLRRALERELFEQRGLSRIVSGPAPVLDVELTAFEEVRGKPDKARVMLKFSVSDERRALLERSLVIERAVEPGAGEDAEQRLAATLAATLAEAVTQVGDQVTAQLAASPQ